MVQSAAGLADIRSRREPATVFLLTGFEIVAPSDFVVKPLRRS
jgi:hypothetical protein